MAVVVVVVVVVLAVLVVLVVLAVVAVVAVAVAVQLVHLRDFLFCETSSIFEVDKIKNEAILRDRLQKWKVTASYQCVLRFFFHSISLKHCTRHKKVRPGHTKCRTCHANHHSKPEDLTLQNATSLRKSAR